MIQKTENNFYDENTPAAMVRWASHQAMMVTGQDNRLCHYDDADQEAALALWRMRGESTPYRMKAAFNQVMMWLRHYLHEEKTHKVGADYPDVCAIEDYHHAYTPTPEEIIISRESRMDDEDILDKVADVLLEIFLAARKQQKGRAVEAAVRDVNIILLSLQGCSLEGIAFEMGIEKSHASSYRTKARRILENYLNDLV